MLCLYLFFWRVGSARLFDMDEGLYVTCARVMAISGDWVTPRLNLRPHNNPAQTTVPFFEKPILTYWAAAGSFKLFGISEQSARLPAATASLIATFLIVWAGSRWLGRGPGLFAGLVYAISPMIIVDARQMTTDSLLTLWFLLAMIAVRERRPFLFAVSCALGVLTKGVIGLLLPLLVIAVLQAARAMTAGWHGQPFKLLRMPPGHECLRYLLAALLFLAIAVPWHVAIYKAGGHDANGRTWVAEYLIRQHIGRFKGLDVVHNAPIFTYVGYFLIGFFPWACFTPFAFRLPPRTDRLAETCAPRPNDAPTETRRFLLCWFWTVFGFFSLSAAKLPTYIVPAYPAAALMVGQWLDRIWRSFCGAGAEGRLPSPPELGAGGRAVARAPEPFSRQLTIGASVALATAALLLLVALIVPAATKARPVMPEPLAQLVILITLTLALGCLAGWLLLRRSIRGPIWFPLGISALALSVMVTIGITVGLGYPILNTYLLGPYQDLAMRARPDARLGSPVVFYSFGDRRPSMSYYARDYSPIERKETPLLPFLEQLLPEQRTTDVITLRSTFEHQLREELVRAHWSVELIGIRDSGLATWILLRIRPPVQPAH